MAAIAVLPIQLQSVGNAHQTDGEQALARQVNATALRSPLVDLSTIGQQICIRVGNRPEGGGPIPLVTTWYVAKTSLKKVGVRALLGGFFGASVGVAAAGITSKVCPKASGKIMKYGVAAAASAGFFIGVVSGARAVKRQVAIRRQVEEITTVDSEVVRSACRVFFDVYFNAADSEEGHSIFCPIGFDIMSVPVFVRCDRRVKHTFDLHNISRWLETHNSCPTCRRRINTRHIQFDTEVCTRIHSVVREALGILANVCGVDLYDDNYIEQVLESGLDENGKPVKAQFDMETIARIRAGKLTPFEGCILARYLRSPLKEFNHVTKESWDQLQTGLENDRRSGRITRDGYLEEQRKLNDWYDAVTVNI